MTLEEMAATLERDYETNHQRVDTLKARLSHLKAAPALGYGRAVLAQLAPGDVEAYKAERLAQKASGPTINRELYVLAHMIARGRDLGHVTGSLRVRLHRMAESPARSGFFEPGQFQAIQAALPKHLRPVVAFGYESGWRLREITSRCWRHVDLEAGTVRLEPGETKNGRPRTIRCSPELVAILRAQRAKAVNKWPRDALEDRPSSSVLEVCPSGRSTRRGRRPARLRTSPAGYSTICDGLQPATWCGVAFRNAWQCGAPATKPATCSTGTTSAARRMTATLPSSCLDGWMSLSRLPATPRAQRRAQRRENLR